MIHQRRKPSSVGKGTNLDPVTHSEPQEDTALHKADVDTPSRLLRQDQVPVWYRQNPYVHSAYRPVLGRIGYCFYSLTFLHNETVNIYSHLIPAIAALASNYFLSAYFSSHFPRASLMDRMVYHAYLTASLLCFGVSSLYHTLLCHSERYNSVWLRCDYAAIVTQILGSFFSGIYIGFYCEPYLQKVYWAMIGTLGSLTCFVVLNPRLQDSRWSSVRLASFIATGLSAFAPIIHAAQLFPYHQLDKQAGLRYYYLEGVFMLVGCVFFATRFPESWRPGRFDVWGASHQIFHVLVVMGALSHLCGILTAFQWNYENPRCPR